MRKIEKIQFITDDPVLIEKACRGGIRWVQLRVKNAEEPLWLDLAAKAKKICDEYKAILIINDNVSVAKIIGADGVHLGKEDMKPTEARLILGDSAIIGGTSNSMEDIQYMAGEGVDYIGLGPFRHTLTKKKLSPLLGLEGYQKIIKEMRTEKPIVAIGGIKLSDIHPLLEAGVKGIAVSSAIAGANDPESAAAAFVRKTEELLQDKI